jgi:uncharacterized membrane protein YjjP (DUF1212 family)
MQTGELMEIALKAGELLLTSGAEIYRVEESVTRICESFGVRCESFVLPTGIFISLKDEQGNDTLTAFKRIRQRTVDLHRIDSVNTFSRSLQGRSTSFDEAMKELTDIGRQKRFNFAARLLASGAASFVFTLLFKGGIGEGIAALVIGMLIYSVREKISEVGFFQFFELLIAGLVAGAAGLLAVGLFPEFNLFKIIIGSITLFLPGVAITSGIKDALYGDLVASLTRLGEAVFTVAAVGAGVALALTIGLKWGPI